MSAQLLLSLAVRSFAPPLFALIIVCAWRKTSASNRRLIWLMTFAVLAALPLALLKLPTVTVVNKPRSEATPITVPSGTSPAANVTGIGNQPSAQSSVASRPAVLTSSPALEPETRHNVIGAVVECGAFLWVLGALLVLAHWITGLIRLSRLDLRPVLDEDIVTQLEIACRRVGLTQLPLVSTCVQVTVPMVFGHLKPQLVLPVEAQTWSAEGLQAVLIHECAHIRRRDWLSLMFSRLLTAIYWFNPMTWLAAGQLRAECEAAADDTVLLCGVSPGMYASELLRIATEVRPSPIAHSLAILQVGPLKQRVARVLEKNRSRGAASPRAIWLSSALGLLLTAAFGFTYQIVDAPGVSQNGYANLDNGRHVRIIAIVKRTATGTQAWNVNGELLPNSFPLPDGYKKEEKPGEDGRYIVFAQTDSASIIVDGGLWPKWSAQSFQTITANKAGMGYYVTCLDGDSLSVTNLITDYAALDTIKCKVLRANRSARVLTFNHVPMNPKGVVASSTDLDLPSLRTINDSSAPGALIGITDLSHPEWGFWRPDGSPLPKIAGIDMRQETDSPHPIGHVTRCVGFLFRSRQESTDRIASSDVSGVLLCHAVSIFHTPSGRYDLDEVFLNPSLTSMSVISKVPQADVVKERVKLARISKESRTENVFKFFANRIGRGAAYYAFDSKLAPLANGMNRSMQFLDVNNSTPAWVGCSTDWEDRAVALNTPHPEKIVAANILEHGYDYFSYANVALFPKAHR